MRLLVLSRSRLLHSTHRFVEECKKRGIVCDVVNPIGCKLEVNSGDPGGLRLVYREEPLADYAAVIPRIGVRTMKYGLLVLQQLQSQGVPTLNEASAIRHVRDKFHCMQLLAGAGLPVPKTVISRSLHDISSIKKDFRDFPVIIKTLTGAQGIGVMLAPDQASLESIALTFVADNKPVMFQEYIKECKGSDIRVMVVDGKCVSAMRRHSVNDDFRANVHRGGRGEPMELTDELAEISVRATEAAGLDVAGIDILESKAGPLVLEVNPSPGFRELELATGVNIAARFVEAAIKRAQ